MHGILLCKDSWSGQVYLMAMNSFFPSLSFSEQLQQRFHDTIKEGLHAKIENNRQNLMLDDKWLTQAAACSFMCMELIHYEQK